MNGGIEQHHDFLTGERLFESHLLLFKLEIDEGVVGIHELTVKHTSLDEGLKDFQVVCCGVLGHPFLQHVSLKIIQEIDREVIELEVYSVFARQVRLELFDDREVLGTGAVFRLEFGA